VSAGPQCKSLGEVSLRQELEGLKVTKVVVLKYHKNLALELPDSKVSAVDIDEVEEDNAYLIVVIANDTLLIKHKGTVYKCIVKDFAKQYIYANPPIPSEKYIRTLNEVLQV